MCGRLVEDMSHVLCCAEVLHDIVKVPEVSVCGVAALCAGEGYSCHDVWSAPGEIQEDTDRADEDMRNDPRVEVLDLYPLAGASRGGAVSGRVP